MLVCLKHHYKIPHFVLRLSCSLIEMNRASIVGYVASGGGSDALDAREVLVQQKEGGSEESRVEFDRSDLTQQNSRIIESNPFEH